MENVTTLRRQKRKRSAIINFIIIGLYAQFDSTQRLIPTEINTYSARYIKILSEEAEFHF